MLRQKKDGSVIKLTKAVIVTGDPISSITYDDEERVTQIVYNVLTKAGTETVDISYSPNSSPIFRSVIYNGGSVNIFQAEITPQVNTSTPAPAILDIDLSPSFIFEGAAIGTVVGTLSIVGGTPPAAFNVSNDPNDLFEADGSELKVKADLIGNSGTYAIEVTAVDSNAQQFVKELNVVILAYSSSLSTQFDGLTEYVFSLSNSAWDTDSRTVSVWAKSPTASPGIDGYIVGKHRGGSGGIYLGWVIEVISNNRIRMSIYQNSSIIKQYQISNNLGPLDGDWHHIAWTYDLPSKVFKIFMDGIEVTGSGLIVGRDDAFTGPINANDQDLTLGVGYSSTGTRINYTPILVDELALFSSALPTGDITDIYNGGVPKSLLQQTYSTDLVSWWRMGEMDTAPTITDVQNVSSLTMVNMDGTNFVGDVPS